MIKIKKTKLSCAIAAAMGLSGTAQGVTLEEVVVTATKRADNVQDVPITVQALGERQLEEQGITNFSDYVQSLPNVNAGGRGPGQNEIYIRGAAVQGVAFSVAEAQGTAPNVALYLDEQPVSAGGRNLDVYAADLERIEVLPGPQGTLFGASSQAGTLRLITNKPNLNEFEAGFKGSFSFTRSGEPSHSQEAVINLPIIEDKLAVRIVGFNDQQGGYIDNVEGVYQPQAGATNNIPVDSISFEPGHKLADGTVVGPDGLTVPVEHSPVSNREFAEDNFNDATYSGFRIGGRYNVNDNWQFTVQHHQQALDVDGVFDFDPDVGDLQVQRFNSDKMEEEFGQTSWTVDGSIGDLELVYTGAYLSREIEQTVAYSAYTSIGAYVGGYTCEYNTPSSTGAGGTPFTFDPTLSGQPDLLECSPGNAFFSVSNENERTTHEFRINTSADHALRFTGGIYYEESEIRSIGDFAYGDVRFNPVDPGQLNDGAGPVTANDPSVRDPRVQFTNDITRPEKQLAVFGELTYDIFDSFSVLVGLRRYDLEIGYEGYSAWKYANRRVNPGLPGVTTPSPNTTGGRDLVTNLADAQPASTKDTIGKFTINWTPNEDHLIYFTWSEGFRPGGFNRAATGEVITPDFPGVAARGNDGDGGFPDYFIPVFFKPDTLTNIELGFKNSFLDGALRFNASIYQIDWDDLQTGIFDPQQISNFTIIDNAGDAEIKGVEGDFAWAVNDRLSLYGAFSYNKTELVAVNPAFAFATAPVGSKLPLAPELQVSLRGRYEWQLGGGLAHAQMALNWADDSFSSLLVNDREIQDAYTLVDATVGYARDGWKIELFADNLSDERAQLTINVLDRSRRITTNRPRSFGVRFAYDFE